MIGRKGTGRARRRTPVSGSTWRNRILQKKQRLDRRPSSATVDRLRKLGARQQELQQRLATLPPEIPDIRPNTAGIYRRTAARLAIALSKPEERDAAAFAIRGLIERIVLPLSDKRGDLPITLRGDLDTTQEWTGNGPETTTTDTPSSGMSVSVVARAGFELATITEPRSGRKQQLSLRHVILIIGQSVSSPAVVRTLNVF